MRWKKPTAVERRGRSADGREEQGAGHGRLLFERQAARLRKRGALSGLLQDRRAYVIKCESVLYTRQKLIYALAMPTIGSCHFELMCSSDCP